MHRIQTFLFSVFLSFTLLLGGCSSSSRRAYLRYRYLLRHNRFHQNMGYGRSNRFRSSPKMCSDFENLFSRTLEGSEIYRINHAQGQPVTVSDGTQS